MPVRRPSTKELQQAARELGLNLNDADALSFHGLMQGQLDAYDLVEDMVAPLPEVRYPRTPGIRPQPEDNHYVISQRFAMMAMSNSSAALKT